MNNLEFPEIKLMVNLIKTGCSLISPKNIQEKIRNTWKKDVSLQLIYKTLDYKFNEDFELESRKMEYKTKNYV